jgi:hypothetical protein
LRWIVARRPACRADARKGGDHHEHHRHRDEGERVLRTTTFFGRASESLQLAPMGNHLFAHARYSGEQLVRIYAPNRRIQFRVEGDKVVGFDNRRVSGELFGTARKVD